MKQIWLFFGCDPVVTLCSLTSDWHSSRASLSDHHFPLPRRHHLYICSHICIYKTHVDKVDSDRVYLFTPSCLCNDPTELTIRLF